MPHAHTSVLVHCIFSTKERRPRLGPHCRERLWAYLGGTARQLGAKTLAVGGIEDHVHVLLSLPAKLPLAVVVQKLKANSSRWLRETFPEQRLFSWQEGYGGFSVGVSQLERTIAYINGQEDHHRKIDFSQEFAAFLEEARNCARGVILSSCRTHFVMHPKPSAHALGYFLAS